MSRHYEELCVGCDFKGADCLGCSLNRKELMVECDQCGDVLQDYVYEYNGEDYCEECLLKQLMKEYGVEDEEDLTDEQRDEIDDVLDNCKEEIEEEDYYDED